MFDGRILPVQGILRRHWFPLLVLTTLILSVFPDWHTSTLLGFDDLARLNAPQRQLLAWFWQHHTLPLWNPFSFAGQPFLAAGQAGPLYLPNLLFIAMPVGSALKLSYLLHELLAAFGMYAFLWCVSEHRFGAVVGSTVFVTSGFMMGHQVHTQMFDAFTWLPVIMWLVVLTLKQLTVARFIALACGFALEVFAGHPQISLFISLTAGMYLAFTVLHAPTTSALKRATGVIGAFVLGLGLSAAAWLPTLDLTSYSSRAQENSSFLLSGSFPITGMLQFLTPFATGGGYTETPFSTSANVSMYGFASYWEVFCYVGVATLAVAIPSALLLFRTSLAVRNLVVILVVSWSLSLGEYSPLKWVLVYAPGFNLFRIPARYIGITDFCIAALTGIGIGALARRQIGTPASQSRGKPELFNYAVGSVSLVFMALIGFLRLHGPLTEAPRSAVWVPCVIALILTVFAFLPHTTARHFATVSGVLCIADVSFGAYSMSSFPLSSTAGYSTPSGAAAYVRQHLPGPYPFMRVAALGDTSLSQDKAAAFTIPAVNGYDSLEPSWYASDVGLTWNADTLLQQPRSLLDALDVEYIVSNGLTTDYLSTKTVGTQSTTIELQHLPPGRAAIQINLKDVPDAPAVFGSLLSFTMQNGSRSIEEQITGWSSGAYLISLPNDWPRASSTTIKIQSENWTSPVYLQSIEVYGSNRNQPLRLEVEKVIGPKAWLPVFTSGTETVWQNPDTLHPAWITNSLKTPLNRSGGSTLKLTEWSANRQTWRVESRHTGWFVLSQMYDPNWTARVDSKIIPVRRVDNVLTGIPIGAGTHALTLVYQPMSFRRGAVVSVLSLFIILCMTAYRGWRRFQRRRSEPLRPKLQLGRE